MTAMMTRRKVNGLPYLAAFMAAVIFFSMAGAVIFSRIMDIQHDVGRVTHTHDVLLSTKNIISLMKDAETGQRGYVITGDEEYLEPYKAAWVALPGELDRLQSLTSDNAQQQRRIGEARAKIAQKVSRLEEAITMRRSGDLDGAVAIVKTGEGKEVMDELRAVIAAITEHENDLRDQRLGTLKISYKQAVVTGTVTCVAGIALALAICLFLLRGAQQRAREQWMQEGRLGLGAMMLGDLNINELGRNVLGFLAHYLNAQAGVFFAQEDGRYRRAATFGFPQQDGKSEYIDGNDNLLGQAIADKKAFIVRDVPPDHLRIGTGLSQGKPRHLVITPALHDGGANAVFELGFMQDLDEDALRLLSEVSEMVGVAVQSAHYRNHLQKLLEETQAQAEEMQAQSEELRVANEELEEQSVAMRESQAKLEQQQEELETSNEELEEQNARIRQQAEELEAGRRELQVKAQELELSSKYKSEFLANMSHELRTPLNSLLILSKNLAANEDGNLTAEQVEESQIIYNGGLELLNLINDILDLSKVEAGKLSIIMDDVTPREITRRMAQQFEPVATDKKLEFVVDVLEGLPGKIYTDSQRAEQILKNMLSNAFKFTERGTVSLTVGRPDAGLKLQRDNLAHDTAIAFTVRDTGIGIDATKLQSIFEAFQQEDGSTDRHYGGTGLGLTIARKLAHMLGGEIHVESEKGKGSAFTLILPLCAPETGAEPQARRPVKAIVPERVHIAEEKTTAERSHDRKERLLLIIEDDPDFASLLAEMARRNGYGAIIAHDGKTGILMAAEYKVSAVLLDLNLPDISGMNVLEQLKHDLRTRHVPIHIITGMSAADTIAPLRKGAIGYLTKPVGQEDMDGAFRRIENVLQAAIKKILVVEDDRKSQAAIQSLLKKKDVEITCIGTGRAALARMNEEIFDCVILDLSLPDMTGFEWLAEMAENKEAVSMPPVIIYTARELSVEENAKLSRYTNSIVIKGAHSSERLLDEVTLFLHSVESSLSQDQQAIIRMQHNPDKVLQERQILLVDDDLRNSFALSKMLKKHGMNVVIADNGQMALEKLAQHSDIELVIMDIMMPVMDGYQAIQKIRMQDRWKKLPVIALTARAMPEEQERCMACGANDYMTKPVDIERLLTLMRVWLFKQEEHS